MEQLPIEYRNSGNLLDDAKFIIETARAVAYRSVNVALVQRNWLLGKRIAEEELKGADRAEYGKRVMMDLADQLTALYGKGFDFGSLYKYVLFFRRFKILGSLSPKSGGLLSWTHYRKLLQVENPDALRWYIDEAAAETWGVRTLQRNISSQYYERMLMSHNKDVVRAEMGTILRWALSYARIRILISQSIPFCMATNSCLPRSTGYAFRRRMICAGR